MALVGLILSALGTLATIIGTYYTRAQFQRDRETQTNRGEARYDRESHHHRWIQINIIGTCLALCVLAVGIFLIVESNSSPKPLYPQTAQSANAEKSAPSDTSIPPVSPSPAQSTSTSTSTSTWSKQWGPKDLLLTSGVYSDLDSVPPNVNADNIGPGFTVYGNQFQYNTMVSWAGSGSGTATPAACADLIATQGVESLKPVMGSTYCVKTNAGNTAIIVVKRIDLDSGNNVTDALVQATIWSSSN